MENETPSYYAIITADVRYDERLAPMEKILYGEFTCLTNKYGFSTASNNYFAKLYNCGTSSVSRWIKHLEECGHITVEYEREGKQIVKRIVRITHPFSSPKMEGYSKNEKRVFQNREEGIPKNAKGILQDVNITSGNITSIPAKPKTDFQIVMDSYFQNYKNLYEQKAVLTEKPIVNMKQAGKMIKDLLPIFGKDKILSALDKALLDNWIVGQGYSLTTILSSNQLNKLINSKGVPARQNYNCVHEFDDKIMLEEM